MTKFKPVEMLDKANLMMVHYLILLFVFLL